MKQSKENRNNTSIIISFIITTMVIIFIGYLLTFVPNELDINKIISNYNLDIEKFVAEKPEKLQYIFLTILFPCIYIIINSIILKFKLLKNNNKLNNLLTIILLFFIFILTFYINVKNKVYFSETVIFKKTISYISIFINFIVFFYMYEKYKLINKKYLNFCILIILSIFILFTGWLYKTDNYLYNSFSQHHFDAYFYPVYKVFSGQTILSDFNCLYGFYPYIMIPFLNFLGGVNMHNFSILMVVLVIAIYYCYTYVLWKQCKNKIIVSIGIIAIMFFTIIFPSKIQGGPYYLQYMPHRVIFPAIILFIATLYIYSTKDKKKYIEKIGYIICSVAVLWNIDTGLVTLIAWFIFLVYTQTLEYSLKEKNLYINSFKYFIFSIISILISYLILGIITFIRTNNWISIKDIIYSQSAFYGSGYFMLKMPLLHQWILLVAIYSVALVKAINNMKFFNNSKSLYYNRRTSIYFILSIIGMGIFSYYQGRSHEYVFIPITWPGFLILILFMEEWVEKCRLIRFNESKLEFTINIIKFILVSFFMVGFALSYLYNIKSKDDVNTLFYKNNESYFGIDETISYIESIKEEDEDIDLIMNNSAIIYNLMNEKTNNNIPSTIDWYTKDDYRKVINWLRTTNNKIILDEFSYNLLEKYCSEDLKNIISERFEVVKHKDSLILLQPIKNEN